MPWLYHEAFTGHVRAIPRCSFCLQEDHVLQTCPRNPNQPWFGWLHDSSEHAALQHRPSTSRLPQSPDYCRQYNEGKCKQTLATCRYTHRCLDCGGTQWAERISEAQIPSESSMPTISPAGPALPYLTPPPAGRN